ncbi:hypothetical protein [Lonepinella sp. BR2474]|uniref:hypothetical protein n=1 Tax=Lonepinella sp. BR2474 TaxID=3434548 RepID=UPI003F6DD018
MSKHSDFSQIVNELVLAESADPTHRYHSFDYCYAHFHPSNTQSRQNLELGCYILWGYLSSWGMLRGSTFLFQKNPAALKELVQFIIDDKNKALWAISLDDYPANYQKLTDLYTQIHSILVRIAKDVSEKLGKEKRVTITLVTKILLGVFGIVPAYDRYFCETFNEIAKVQNKKATSFYSFDENSLSIIHDFYLENKQDIKAIQAKLKVIDFNGNPTDLTYSAAKVIDMYGFNKLYNSNKG